MESSCLVEIFHVDWGEVLFEVEIGHAESGKYNHRINAYPQSIVWTQQDTLPLQGMFIPDYVRRKAMEAVDRLYGDSCSSIRNRSSKWFEEEEFIDLRALRKFVFQY